MSGYETDDLVYRKIFKIYLWWDEKNLRSWEQRPNFYSKQRVEKVHNIIFFIYLEKNIPKLILENKHKISDPKDIRNEQKQFYNKLQNLQNKGLNSFINIIKIFIFMWIY